MSSHKEEANASILFGDASGDDPFSQLLQQNKVDEKSNETKVVTDTSGLFGETNNREKIFNQPSNASGGAAFFEQSSETFFDGLGQQASSLTQAFEPNNFDYSQQVTEQYDANQWIQFDANVHYYYDEQGQVHYYDPNTNQEYDMSQYTYEGQNYEYQYDPQYAEYYAQQGYDTTFTGTEQILNQYEATYDQTNYNQTYNDTVAEVPAQIQSEQVIDTQKEYGQNYVDQGFEVTDVQYIDNGVTKVNSNEAFVEDLQQPKKEVTAPTQELNSQDPPEDLETFDINVQESKQDLNDLDDLVFGKEEIDKQASDELDLLISGTKLESTKEPVYNFNQYDNTEHEKKVESQGSGDYEPQQQKEQAVDSYEPQNEQVVDSYELQKEQVVDSSSYEPQSDQAVDYSSYEPQHDQTVNYSPYEPQQDQQVVEHSYEPQQNEKIVDHSYEPQQQNQQAVDYSAYEPQHQQAVDNSSYEPQQQNEQAVDYSSYEPQPQNEQTVDYSSYEPQHEQAVNYTSYEPQPQNEQTVEYSSYEPQHEQAVNYTSYEPQPQNEQTVDYSSYEPQHEQAVNYTSYEPQHEQAVNYSSYEPQHTDQTNYTYEPEQPKEQTVNYSTFEQTVDYSYEQQTNNSYQQEAVNFSSYEAKPSETDVDYSSYASQAQNVEGTERSVGPPPSITSVVSPPPMSQVVPTPSMRTVVSPPPMSQAVPPSPKNQVAPPSVSQAVPPPPMSQAIPPPPKSQAPPMRSTAISPPPMRTMSPPPMRTVISPPPMRNNTMSPPMRTVISPPPMRNNTMSPPPMRNNTMSPPPMRTINSTQRNAPPIQRSNSITEPDRKQSGSPFTYAYTIERSATVPLERIGSPRPILTACPDPLCEGENKSKAKFCCECGRPLAGMSRSTTPGVFKDEKKEKVLSSLNKFVEKSVVCGDKGYIEDRIAEGNQGLVWNLVKLIVQYKGFGGELEKSMSRLLYDCKEEQVSLLDELEGYLRIGDREGGCEFAMKNDLWSHALIISQSQSIELFRKVVSRFGERELMYSDVELKSRVPEDRKLLRVLYSVFSGAGEDAVLEFGSLESEWRKVVSFILVNRSEKDNQSIRAVGDELMKLNCVYDALVCYMLSQDSSLESKMIKDLDLDVLYLLEFYDFGLGLNLNGYKLILSWLLKEFGFDKESKIYIDLIKKNVTCLEQVQELKKVGEICSTDSEKFTSLLSKGCFDTLIGSIEESVQGTGSLHDLNGITHDKVQENYNYGYSYGGGYTGTADNNEKPFGIQSPFQNNAVSSPFGHGGYTANESTWGTESVKPYQPEIPVTSYQPEIPVTSYQPEIPATSYQPEVPTNYQSEVSTQPNNYAVEEDEDLGFGNSKPKPKEEIKEEIKEEKPNEISEEKKEVKSGGWGIFSLFGRKEVEEKKPVRANLGEQSSFYYDEKEKRWVNKLNDAKPAAASTPPPPKAPVASVTPKPSSMPPMRIQSTPNVLTTGGPPNVAPPTFNTPPVSRRVGAGARKPMRSRYVDVLNTTN